MRSGRKAPLRNRRTSTANQRVLHNGWTMFVNYCLTARLAHPQDLRDNAEKMDGQLCSYIEFLYEKSRPLSLGKAALLAVQDKFRRLRSQLVCAWDVLGTWQLEQPLRMRVPIPPSVTWCLFDVSVSLGLSLRGSASRDWCRFGVACLLLFYGLLERFNITASDLSFPVVLDGTTRVLVRILRAKNMRVMGKGQVAVITKRVCVIATQRVAAQF